MSSVTSTRRLALAIDVGGTKVEAALVDNEARVLTGSRQRAETGRGSSGAMIAEAVGQVAERAMATAPADAEVIGAGIGSAGPISLESETVSPLNLPAWRGFPLARLVEERTGLAETVLRLDGLCILLAEYWAGSLAGVRTAMGMVVSTGIGGGLIVEGRLVGGRTGNAGHVGQILLPDTDAAGLQSASTLEDIASGPNIVEWARRQGWTGNTGEDLAADYGRHDRIAVAAVHRCARALGAGIASVCALLDLEAVAIGGGFARVAPDLLDLVRAAVDEVAPLETIRDVRVLPTALGDDGPLVGAAGLIHRDDLLPDGRREPDRLPR